MILSVKNLKKFYQGRSVVNNLSFDVNPGEVVGLIGPNGAGKTTAFYMTMGLISPDSGQVWLKDKNVTDLPIYRRAEMGMGYLAQEPSIFKSLSVEDNIKCVLENSDLSKKERKEKLIELLCELHLEKLAKKKASTLSGGERRRLEITRALALNPTLLLLDEPFANIDPLTIQDLKKMIQILKQKGISILITDHNARELASIIDRCYLIQDGKTSLSGKLEELLDNKLARSSYFGDDFTL